MPIFPTPARPSRMRRTGAALLVTVTCSLAMTAGPAIAAAPAGVESAATLAAPASINVSAPLVTGMPAKAAAAKKYANCTALNRVYPHGVGKSGAVDRVSGKTKPVKNFTRNNALYTANAKSDRDKDGIACEKR